MLSVATLIATQCQSILHQYQSRRLYTLTCSFGSGFFPNSGIVECTPSAPSSAVVDRLDVVLHYVILKCHMICTISHVINWVLPKMAAVPKSLFDVRAW